MTEAFLSHLSFALGDDTSTVDESYSSGKTFSEPSSLKEAGFDRHHICHPRTSAYQLAKAAVQQIQPHFTEVGAIIYSTCLPLNGTVETQHNFHDSKDIQDLMNFPVNHLQVDFNLTKATAFGLNQQSSTGILGSIRLAKALLATEESLKQVLCVTSDRLPDGASYEQSNNLISDGAAACIISAKPEGFRILSCYSNVTGTMEAKLNGKATENFLQHGETTILEALKTTGLDIAELNWIIPQNTNTKAWKSLCNTLHFDFNKVYFPSLGQVAHVMGGDTLINLLCLIQEHKVQPGDKILLFMSGYGINWQCVLLERV
jgi:3-oxoacyl-[acyl-carrier-protein] synthase III